MIGRYLRWAGARCSELHATVFTTRCMWTIAVRVCLAQEDRIEDVMAGNLGREERATTRDLLRREFHQPAV
jgi:hypothetical protein